MFFIEFNLFFFYIFLAYFICLVGIYLTVSHFIILLIFLDLIILINIILLVSFTVISHSNLGFIYGILILGVAAADTAVGLGLFILFFKTTNKVSII